MQRDANLLLSEQTRSAKYCCTVWHCGLPRYLSEQVEKIQKRALRIILPGRSCSEPQEMLECPWLDIRRSELCEKTMHD